MDTQNSLQQSENEEEIEIILLIAEKWIVDYKWRLTLSSIAADSKIKYLLYKISSIELLEAPCTSYFQAYNLSSN